MTGKRHGKDTAVIADELALAGSKKFPAASPVQFYEDIARGFVTDIYRAPWDTPEIIMGRRFCSYELAENLLDIDLEGRAALYSRLGDKKLGAFHRESSVIQTISRRALLIASLSFTSVGVIAG